MIKKIRNNKLGIDDIFKATFVKGRIGQIRLDKNERADSFKLFLNKLKKIFLVI